MANFYSEHNTRVKSRTRISKSKLTEGMVVKCRYESQDQSGGEYILLILDVNYKGQLHALSLNEFNSRTFINLAKTVGTSPVLGNAFEKNNILKRWGGWRNHLPTTVRLWQGYHPGSLHILN